jgi:hypothetical protein
MASNGNGCDHAFAKRAVAQAIRETCAEVRRGSYTQDEVLATFEVLARVVENPHPFGEFVPKENCAHDDTPHGPLWDTGEEEER